MGAPLPPPATVVEVVEGGGEGGRVVRRVRYTTSEGSGTRGYSVIAHVGHWCRCGLCRIGGA